MDIVTKGLAYTKRTFRYSSNKGARGLTRHPIRDYSQDRGGASKERISKSSEKTHAGSGKVDHPHAMDIENIQA